jgi:hypothetical protein
VAKLKENLPERKWFCQVSWSEVPHLTEEAKNDLLRSIPPYLRDARTKGIPMLGSGAIYPVSEDDILVAPFTIPSYWPQAYALDVGWNRTAAVWGARDNSSGIIYLWAEYYQGQQQPAIHAYGIKSRGDWIPGVIDPAARGRSQIDGRKLLNEYRKLGLDLQPANNTVEAGIAAVWQALSSGRLKVFKNLTSFLSEFRIYQRDKKGKIVKVNDHIMDCVRYLWMSGRERMIPMPVAEKDQYSYDFADSKPESKWMQ